MAKVAGCGCWDCPTLARCLAAFERADESERRSAAVAAVHADYARRYPEGEHSDAQRQHRWDVLAALRGES